MTAANDTQEQSALDYARQEAERWKAACVAKEARCAVLARALGALDVLLCHYTKSEIASIPGLAEVWEQAREALGAAPAREELPGGDLGGPRPAGVRRCNHTYKHGPHDVYHDGIPWRCPGDVPTSSGGVTLTEEQAERLVTRAGPRYPEAHLIDVLRDKLALADRDKNKWRSACLAAERDLALLRGEQPR